MLAIVFKLSVQCIPPLACISLHLSINALHWQHEYLYDSLDHNVECSSISVCSGIVALPLKIVLPNYSSYLAQYYIYTVIHQILCLSKCEIQIFKID